MRLAHGLTQWQAARRWNERWPAEDGGAGITGQVISYNADRAVASAGTVIGSLLQGHLEGA